MIIRIEDGKIFTDAPASLFFAFAIMVKNGKLDQAIGEAVTNDDLTEEQRKQTWGVVNSLIGAGQDMTSLESFQWG